ncbi:MAG: hypothetical protein HY775_09705 [Acidobacteria bacterium]|nr:hypothetical protein [Acidobacteriota bacterium]
MKSGVDLKRLLMGATVMAVAFALGDAAASALAPPIGTPRPTDLDLLLRLVPAGALVGGAYVGTRRCHCSRLRQGLASIAVNWLALALLSFAQDRMTGENIFDPYAIFVTAAPWFILLGAAGVAIAAFTERRSRRAFAGGWSEA